MTSDLLEGAQNRSHERSSERTPKISLIRERSGTTKLPYDRAWRPERNLDKGTESAWSAGREGNPNSESEYERGVGEQLWSPKRASDCSRPEQIGRGNSPFWACPTARILKVAHIGAFFIGQNARIPWAQTQRCPCFIIQERSAFTNVLPEVVSAPANLGMPRMIRVYKTKMHLSIDQQPATRGGRRPVLIRLSTGR